MSGRLPVTLGVAAAVVVADQVTKAVAVAQLEGQPPVPVVGDLLQLDLVRNPGAAFSLAGNYTIIISVVAIVVSVVILRTSRTLTSLAWAVVLGGILGGALGNLIDRLLRGPEPLRGHVVDFIALPNFPVFNVADMALTCSAVAAMVLSFKGVELTTHGDAIPSPAPADQDTHDPVAADDAPGPVQPTAPAHPDMLDPGPEESGAHPRADHPSDGPHVGREPTDA